MATLLTPPAQLRDAAADLRREAAKLDSVHDHVREALRPEAFRDHWEGRIADRFCVHTDGEHRVAHIDRARDRIRGLADALDRAADENDTQIAVHRRIEHDLRAELARRGDGATAGRLPTSVRDTSWPRWQRWIVGGQR